MCTMAQDGFDMIYYAFGDAKRSETGESCPDMTPKNLDKQTVQPARVDHVLRGNSYAQRIVEADCEILHNVYE